MSDDKRKNLRTQGRFSGELKEKPSNKNARPGTKSYSKERMQRNSPPDRKDDIKNSPEANNRTDVKQRNENEISVMYEDNSNYTSTFSQMLGPVKKPTEIKSPGLTVLSTTEYGESRVIFKPDLFDSAQANQFFKVLKDTTKWYEKNIFIKGREVPQPRLVAWYGPFPYEYSGVTLEPKEMTSTILHIKAEVERVLEISNVKVVLNSVLLNLYRNGRDSVAWHSDDELSMGVDPTIASVSLGETRKFEMRRKPAFHKKDFERDTKEDAEFFVHLSHGSLIVMDGVMQKDWQHQVPKEYHDKLERINLTFRTVHSKHDLPFKEPQARVRNYASIAKSPQIKREFKEDSCDDNNTSSDSSALQFQSKVKGECCDDNNTCSDPFAKVMNEIDSSKPVAKETERRSSPKIINNLSKDTVGETDVPVTDLKPPVYPVWAINAINASEFTCQNMNVIPPPYETSMQNPEMLNHGFVGGSVPFADNGSLVEGYSQYATDALDCYPDCEQSFNWSDCLDMAKWYYSNKHEIKSNPEDVMKHLPLFRDVPFEDFTKELHLTKRDCDELHLLCLVAREAHLLSEDIRCSMFLRMCTIIANADFYFSRDRGRGYRNDFGRNFDGGYKAPRSSKFNSSDNY